MKCWAQKKATGPWGAIIAPKSHWPLLKWRQPNLSLARTGPGPLRPLSTAQPPSACSTKEHQLWRPVHAVHYRDARKLDKTGSFSPPKCPSWPITPSPHPQSEQHQCPLGGLRINASHPWLLSPPPTAQAFLTPWSPTPPRRCWGL